MTSLVRRFLKTAIAFLAVGLALGAYAFAYGLWRTIDGPPQMRRAEARVRASQGAPLPVSPATR